jgi:hypothetical protein
MNNSLTTQFFFFPTVQPFLVEPVSGRADSLSFAQFEAKSFQGKGDSHGDFRVTRDFGSPIESALPKGN